MPSCSEPGGAHEGKGVRHGRRVYGKRQAAYAKKQPQPRPPRVKTVKARKFTWIG